MIYLFFSILCSASIFILFRFFPKYKVNNLPAIVINYLVAITFGFTLIPPNQLKEIITKEWLPQAAIIGIGFLILFYLIATVSQKISITVASVANKMSVVIPVVFSIILYNESVSFLKIFGIAMVLVGIILVTLKKDSIAVNNNLLFLPFLLFIGNGLIDTFIKHTQNYYVNGTETTIFVPVIFVFALIAGILLLLVKKIKIAKQDIYGGLILGIPNYGSIYFLMKTLEYLKLESSVIFPLNNMSIVIASTLLSVLIFKEKLSLKNWLGVAISIGAVYLITIS